MMREEFAEVVEAEIVERVRMRKGEQKMQLFVYGTLMIPEVLRWLGLSVPRFVEGTVTGCRTVTLPNVPYPMLMEDDTGKVEGLIWRNVQEREIEVIRGYEGGGYEEARVWASDKGGHKHDCVMFVPRYKMKAGWTPKHAMEFYAKEDEKE